MFSVSYDIKKFNIIDNIVSLKRNLRISSDDSIYYLMDMYLTAEMYEEVSIILDIQYEISKLKQNIITIHFNRISCFTL